MEELRRKLDEAKDENDYLETKVAKLESTNTELRLAKDPKNETKKLQAEIDYLQQQLKDRGQPQAQADPTIKKQLSLAEQQKIQKELAQSDLIIKGYHEENQRADQKLREQATKLRSLEKELAESLKKCHELEIKKMLDKDQVLVTSEAEVDMKTQNMMGNSAITSAQLKEFHENHRKVLAEND